MAEFLLSSMDISSELYERLQKLCAEDTLLSNVVQNLRPAIERPNLQIDEYNQLCHLRPECYPNVYFAIREQELRRLNTYPTLTKQE